jgi:hypothetical protein
VYAFPAFVYLDVQKTGSGFVVEFLNRFARDEPVAFGRHKPVAIHDPDKFHFITCRDPLDQYLSLYSFGRAGQGGFRKRQGPGMYDGTAAGFSAWLRSALDDRPRDRDDANEMRRYAKSGLAPFIGFQSFRFLHMSFAAPWAVLAECRSAGDLRAAFRTKRIWNEAIRSEELSSALASLVKRVLAPHLTDVDAALAWLAAGERSNESERVDKAAGFTVSDDDRRLVQEREWLFFEELGYAPYLPELPRLPLDALG